MKSSMLWTALLIVLAVWALGMVLRIAGQLIHILLVVALVVLILKALQGSRIV